MGDVGHPGTAAVRLIGRPRAGGRTRGRLSRTVSSSRWNEYRALLVRAQAEGYAIVPLEDWLDNDRRGERVLVLRHDVDQCPRSAMRMLGIERRLSIASTWYFRWRTARPRVVNAVLAAGGQVGLHYETLTRAVLAARHEGAELDPAVALDGARRQLRRELIAFSVLFGPARSACAHGDTRVPDVNNAELLRGVDLDGFGLDYDANASMRSHDLAVWLTDRSKADGGWRDGLDGLEIIASHASPVLLLTHPNNWVSGPGLWADRITAAVLPEPRLGATRALRTGSDQPPLDR